LGHPDHAALTPKNRSLDPNTQRHQGLAIGPRLLQSTTMFPVELGPNVGGRNLPVNVHVVILDKFFKLTQDGSTYVDLNLSDRLENDDFQSQ
jgi:hypothetical protein